MGADVPVRIGDDTYMCSKAVLSAASSIWAEEIKGNKEITMSLTYEREYLNVIIWLHTSFLFAPRNTILQGDSTDRIDINRYLPIAEEFAITELEHLCFMSLPPGGAAEWWVKMFYSITDEKQLVSIMRRYDRFRPTNVEMNQIVRNSGGAIPPVATLSDEKRKALLTLMFE